MATSTLGNGTLVLAGTTSGTTTVTATAVAGTTTLTLPAATDTLVGKATTDTLTNKTLTGAVMNGTLGATTPSTVAATTLTTSSTVTHNGGTVNGVAYLDGSKVLTTGSALVFDGTNLGLGVTPSASTSNYRTLQIGSSGAKYSIFGQRVAGNAETFVGWNAYGGNNTTTVGTGYYYTNTGDAATLYTQTDNHRWWTAPSGTAGNAITFTQSMTLDASGNLGIGITSPTYRLQVNGTINTAYSTTNTLGGGTFAYVSNASTTNGTDATIRFDALGSASPAAASISGVHTGDGQSALTFGTRPNGSSSVLERARIDSSGNLLVGMTSTTPSNALGFVVNNSNAGISYTQIQHASGTSSGASYEVFYYNASPIGSITQNGTTGVLYNLTSDYRLKNHQQALTGAKDFIMALKPKKWQWWDGSGEGIGFIAHEFMEVAKYSGNGEKDAVDADGKPVYQSIQPSSSEVMANLVAFIQEQNQLITQLTARITALESA